MKTDFETIKIDIKGRVALVSLNRPDSLNALNSQVMAEIVEAFEGIDANPEIAVSVLTGEGRLCCRGRY